MARPLLKISVPKPCSENWNAMTPQAKGRFCASCATTVVDFSQFTDQQLLDYFAKPAGKTCGRFSASQLNRAVYTEMQPKQNFFPRLIAAVALFLGISSQTQAQTYYSHPVPTGQTIEQKSAGEESSAKTIGKTPEKVSGGGLVIEGKVIDKSTRDPLPFVTIVAKDLKLVAQTDLEGNFKLVLADTFQLTSFQLEFLYIGYEKMMMHFTTQDLPLSHTFELKPDENVLSGEVIVTQLRKTPGYYLRSFWWKTKNLFRKND